METRDIAYRLKGDHVVHKVFFDEFVIPSTYKTAMEGLLKYGNALSTEWLAIDTKGRLDREENDG